ncbi:MAG: hypothetical protein M3Z15_08155 [Pseudomonadota bacterium]|nr:hypothetical protein [Pseudomonadota bacterium]
MEYIVLGVIAPNGSNQMIAGQDTYLVSTSSDWFAWDGEHSDHASKFSTPELALAAARTCRGPIFRMPEPRSIHVVKVEDN